MLRSRLPQIAAQLGARLDIATRAGAEIIAAQAKTRAPTNTGTLRDSIHVEREGAAEYAVIAGDDDVFYGHLVEHGTSHTAPRPFLIPATESSKPAVIAAAQKAIRGL
jgi:HK97 gp10 family phage protein